MKSISIFDCGIHLGGAEKSIELIIKYLKQYYSFNLYIPKDARMHANCNILRINIDKKYFIQNKRSILSLITFLKLFYYGFNNSFDNVIITNTFKSHIIGFANKLRYKNVKWIIAERDVPEGILIKLLKFIFHREADRVIFNSYFLKEQYIEINNSSVIYNIIENKKIILKKSYNRFLYIGDITYSKGFDRVIDVFKRLEIKGKQLFVIGKIPEYQKNIKVYNNKNIIYTGYTDIENFHKKAGFILLFNRQKESFSRIIAEALYYKTIPVILKNNGMNDYTVNGENAIVFEHYNHDTIVSFLNDFIKNNQYDSMNIDIKNKNDFNIDNIKEKWLEIL